MKWLSAGLIFVLSTTLCALLLGLAGGGLRLFAATWAVLVGIVFAFVAYVATNDDPTPGDSGAERGRYHQLWFWGLATIFTIFAVRSFCWLFYIDGAEYKIQ